MDRYDMENKCPVTSPRCECEEALAHSDKVVTKTYGCGNVYCGWCSRYLYSVNDHTLCIRPIPAGTK